ncbi:hypothetical protein MPH_08218 [Macrophomina phaseolina MS6]|uniref:Uncharacterized protein n=1 Tax=Macrophomina phaseolina (strain MS6) TaxID=1126212 RepID=K2RIZ8_MACPH|nr:hypothetical protein MPH_08218 [Macrophomina phaseolina MS6]
MLTRYGARSKCVPCPMKWASIETRPQTRPEDDDETVRGYQSVHSSNSDESWTGSNIEILSDDDTVAEELSPRKARNSDLDTRKRRHSASPPLPAKIPCLRESYREELWPNDVRLNDFELRLLYNCIRRSQFPVRVRHELAPYAFKLDGGRPYAVNAHARHPLDDETSALIFRVLGQPDWVGKVENARKLMKNRGNTREHSAFCARNVTESFRELFRRAGMNGDQRHQHFPGAIPSNTEQRQAAGENVADNYRPKTGRTIRDDSVEFVEERVRDFHPPQETLGQFQESFRNILIETLQEVLSARTTPSGSDARSIVRGNAQKPAGDGVAESSTAGRRPGKHVDLRILQALPKASSTTHGSTQGSASRYSAAEAGPSTREARRQGNPHICPSSKHDGDLPEPFCGLHIKAIPRCTALMGNIVVWAMHVKSIADCRDENYHSKELISACLARAYPEVGLFVKQPARSN